MKKKTSRFKWIVLALVGTAMLIPIIMGIVLAVLPSAIVSAPNSGLKESDLPGLPSTELHELGVDRDLRFHFGDPPVSVSLWVIEPEREPRGTVLVLHGIRSDKSSQLGMGRRLANEGYRAVLVDLRGHGGTTGEFITYGVLESADIERMLDRLDAVGLLSGRVGVIGVSYGGAIALQAAGRDDRIRAVVAVAAFSSMREAVPGYVKHKIPLIGSLISRSAINKAIDEAGALAGFDPDAASPLRMCRSSSAHMLFIHGSHDTQIPASHSRALKQAVGDRGKIVLIQGGTHDSVTGDQTGRVARESLAWFEAWLDQP
jgi:pimeloyl-ACP methyl ester carboxylesterase